MNQAMKPGRHVSDTQAIVVDEVFPHAHDIIWKALTSGELIGRWLMAPDGFVPVTGNRFTFQTKPAGKWDGTRNDIAYRNMSEGWKKVVERLDTVVAEEATSQGLD